MHLWLEEHREAVLVSVVQSLVSGVVLAITIILLRRPTPADIVIRPMETAAPPVAAPTNTPQSIAVYILGAVESPGVYQLSGQSRVQDVVSLAGGLTANADPVGINLAERVYDGQQLFVPAYGQTAPTLPTPAAAPNAPGQVTSGSLININTADAATLATLPGIGPVIAQRVVDFRLQNGPFDRVDDITQVSGIGPATLAKVRDLIAVR